MTALSLVTKLITVASSEQRHNLEITIVSSNDGPFTFYGYTASNCMRFTNKLGAKEKIAVGSVHRLNLWLLLEDVDFTTIINYLIRKGLKVFRSDKEYRPELMLSLWENCGNVLWRNRVQDSNLQDIFIQSLDSRINPIVHKMIVNIVIALESLELAQYHLLFIVDWLPYVWWMSEKRKIAIIESVLHSIRNVKQSRTKRRKLIKRSEINID